MGDRIHAKASRRGYKGLPTVRGETVDSGTCLLGGLTTRIDAARIGQWDPRSPSTAISLARLPCDCQIERDVIPELHPFRCVCNPRLLDCRVQLILSRQRNPRQNASPAGFPTYGFTGLRYPQWRDEAPAERWQRRAGSTAAGALATQPQAGVSPVQSKILYAKNPAHACRAGFFAPLSRRHKATS